MNELEENGKILGRTEIEIQSILTYFSQDSPVKDLTMFHFNQLVLSREKNFASNYSFLDHKEGFYQMNIYIPKRQVSQLMDDLNAIRREDVNFAKPKMIETTPRSSAGFLSRPPTMFKLHDLVKPFQMLVDTYGIPRYKELNPSVFTVISFPFFFGVMFGDFGHGLLLLIVALFLQKSSNESLKEFSQMLLLMGFYSTFCGLIYNEFFSVALIPSESCYDMETRMRKKGCVYEFGFDWIWAISSTETAFMGSFKMKFSIIIGVIHMLFGTLLKAFNSIYFSNYLDLFCEAIPQFVLMAVTFGYMSFCIIIKWLTNWENRDSISIIQVFINFTNVTEPLYGTKELQQSIQINFMILSFLSIFIMLLVKPFVLWSRQKPKHKKSIHSLLKENESDPGDSLIGNVC